MRHHVGMYLSSTEVALAASAITAASGWLIAVASSRLNSRRDHEMRVWEREREVYEYMLSRVEYWSDLRRNAIFAIDRTDNVEAPDPLEFEADGRLIQARLDLFGKPEVRDAYEQAIKEGMKFVDAIVRNHLQKASSAASAGESALPDARSALIEASKVTLDAQEKLIAVARSAINQTPKRSVRRRVRGRVTN
jgi:hypothetical protein